MSYVLIMIGLPHVNKNYFVAFFLICFVENWKWDRLVIIFGFFNQIINLVKDKHFKKCRNKTTFKPSVLLFWNIISYDLNLYMLYFKMRRVWINIFGIGLTFNLVTIKTFRQKLFIWLQLLILKPFLKAFNI